MRCFAAVPSSLPVIDTDPIRMIRIVAKNEHSYSQFGYQSKNLRVSPQRFVFNFFHHLLVVARVYTESYCIRVQGTYVDINTVKSTFIIIAAMGFQDFPFELQIKVKRSVPVIRGKLIRKREPKCGDLFD